MGNRHLQHVRSNQLVDNEPKLPLASDIKYGELAINYAKGNETISLKNSDDEIVSFNIGKSVKNIQVNDVDATIENNIASVTISGSDANVGEYDSVEYPIDFSAATNVSGDQTIAEAFNAVETTISALTDELIKDEKVISESIIQLTKSSGLNNDGEITYSADTNANYINNATSLFDADSKLDSAIKSIDDEISDISSDIEEQLSGKSDVGHTHLSNEITIENDYESIVYPSEFSSATNVQSGQTISEAFNSVEETISALTQEVIDNEEIAATAIVKLANGAGLYNSSSEIAYEADQNSNYLKNATSLYNADSILDSAIQNLSSSTNNSLSSVTFNNIESINTDHNANLSVSGNDINVGEYNDVQYPTQFSSATNVSGDQTIAEAFNSVETTISALTKELIDDELITEKGFVSISKTLGISDSEGVIEYIPNENANYISAATSFQNADDLLDATIHSIADSAQNAISSVTVNNIISDNIDKNAIVSISGNDINVGEYNDVEYPTTFSSATNVSGDQTIAEAFNSVETTISALTQEVLDNEKVIAESIVKLADGAGLYNSSSQIKYEADQNSNYLKNATSLYNADSILDSAIQSISGNVQNSISSITVNGINGTTTNKNASVSISGNNIQVGDYNSVTYPTSFTSATNVSGSQTVAQAFNAVETTMSAITNEMGNKANVYRKVNHGTGDTTFALTENVQHVWDTVSALTLTLATPQDNTIINEYLFTFTSPLSATTLSLPNTVKWVFELVVEPEKTYTISIIDNLATYLTEDMSITGADESVLNQKENISNKVTSINQNSTDIQYPSAKCVYDYIEARLAQLNS